MWALYRGLANERMESKLHNSATSLEEMFQLTKEIKIKGASSQSTKRVITTSPHLLQRNNLTLPAKIISQFVLCDMQLALKKIQDSKDINAE